MPEPVEITWTPEGIEVIYASDREWGAERIAVRLSHYGERECT